MPVLKIPKQVSRLIMRKDADAVRCDICSKVLVTSILSLLLIELIVLVPSYRSYVEDLESEIANSGLELLTQIQFGLNFSNLNAVDTALFDSIISRDRVIALSFYDSSNKLLHDFGQPSMDYISQDLQSNDRLCCDLESMVSRHRQQTTTVSSLMTLNDNQVRTFLTLDNGNLTEQAHDYLFRVLGLVALICLAVTGSIVLVMGRYATKIKHETFHDLLTDLPNRRRLTQLLDNAINDNQPFDLAIVDIDNFQSYRERWGYQHSENLIEQVAKTIQSELDSDWILSRFRDDVFALLVRVQTNPEKMQTVISRVQQAIREPMCVDHDEVSLTACVGVYSSTNQPAGDAVLALDGADLALQHAKAAGNNQLVHFSPSFREERDQRISVITRLRAAMADGQLSLHYQPQFHAKDGSLAGVETLMRWHHPELGFISPAVFIPLAERTGIIVDYGEWALKQAVEQFARWRDAGIAIPRISVNVSPRQFNDSKLVETAADLVSTFALKAGDLELEITESAVINAPDVAQKKMGELRDLGIEFAIDDFGTGHSSLSNLGTFPFSRLKIDQSFVRTLGTSRASRSITKSCIKLAHELNMDVVAEGVEEKTEFDFVSKWQCDIIQGYYFSKPLTAGALETLILEQTSRDIKPPRCA